MAERSLNSSNLKEKAIKGVKIASITFLIVKISALIKQIILARILAPEDFGLMAFCLVIVGFLENLINFRMHDTIIQTQENEKDMLNAGFTIQFLIAVIFVIGVLIFSKKISHILNRPLMTVYLKVLSFRILSSAFIMPQALLHRKFDYKSIKIPEITESLVNTLVAITLAIAGFGIWSLIWGVMAGWLVSMIIILAIAGGLPTIYVNFALLRKALTFGAPLYLTCIVHWVFWNADDFIVGKLLGDKSLGYYWMAFYLGSHLIELRFILSKVSFPVFARLQDNKDELTKALSELTKSSAFIFLLISALFIPLAQPTLNFVFGEKWIPATIPFMIFIGLVSFRSIFGHGSELLLGTAKTRQMLVISLLQFFILIIIGPFATSRLGITGMAITVSLAVFLSYILLIGYVKRTIRINYIKMLWRSFLIAIAVAFIAFLLKPLVINLINLILVMAGCAFLYVALFMIADKLFIEKFKSYLLTILKV